MTQTISLTETSPRHASGFLMNLVVTILAPIFLGVTGGDIGLARMAAVETIDDFRARNHMDLIAVTQVITNGLAAVDSLCRSMTDDLSVSVTLRLRGNAISLNRAVEQNRRALRQNSDAAPVVFHAESVAEPKPPVQVAENDTPLEQDGPPQPDMLMNDAAILLLTAEADARLLHPVEQPTDKVPAEPTAAATDPAIANRLVRRLRAKAMIAESSDLIDSLRTLPPAERRDAEIRIAALGDLIHEVLTGRPPTREIDATGDSNRDGAMAENYALTAQPAAAPAHPPPR